MTDAEFISKMINDTDFYIRFVLENNLPAVNNNLVACQLIPAPTDIDNAEMLIHTLLRQGQHYAFLQIINVDYRFNAPNATAGYAELVQQLERLNPNANWTDDKINMSDLFRVLQSYTPENIVDTSNDNAMSTPAPKEAAKPADKTIVFEPTPVDEHTKSLYWLVGFMIAMTLFMFIAMLRTK